MKYNCTLFCLFLCIFSIETRAEDTLQWLNLINLTESGHTLNYVTAGLPGVAASRNVLHAADNGSFTYTLDASTANNTLFGFASNNYLVADADVPGLTYPDGASGTFPTLIFYININGGKAYLYNQENLIDSVSASTSPPDSFKIEKTQTAIIYYKNNSFLDSVDFNWACCGNDTDAGLNLHVGVVVETSGGDVSPVKCTFATLDYPVTWSYLDSCSLEYNGITVINNTLSSPYSSNAYSANKLAATADGYIDYLDVDDYYSGSPRGFGFSSSNTDIDSACVFLFSSGTVYIYEAGHEVGSYGSEHLGDFFEVQRTAGYLKYKINGYLVYDSTRTVGYADSSLYVINGLVGSSTTISIVTASFPIQPAPVISSTTTAYCAGSVGYFTLSVANPVWPHYKWYKNGTAIALSADSSVHAELSPPSVTTTYQVKAFDTFGDTLSSNIVTITVGPIVINSHLTNVAPCHGYPTGIDSIFVSGGAGVYTSYSWFPSGGTSTVATGLNAGTYTVTVTDVQGCTATKHDTIKQPDTLSVSILTSTNVSCHGGNNGSITATISGPPPAYTYIWFPERDSSITTYSSSANESGLAANTYTVVASDADCGGFATATVTITQPATALSASITSSNVLCYGASTGSATVSASGGTAGYTYSWSSGGTTSSISGLSAGTYTVTVTDLHSCTASTTTTITQPSSALSPSITSSNVSCYGGSNGAATVSVSGGTSGYTYSWSSGATTSGISGLSAGTYTVTVTDGHGCTATATATLNTVTSFTWNGSTSTDWNTAANWTPSGVPLSCDTAIIVSGSNIAQVNSSDTVNALIINSGSLKLNATLTVSQKLTLLKGIIYSDTVNILSILNDGIVTGGSDSSYVVGAIKKTGDVAFTFPLGDSSLSSEAYHALSISAPSSTSDEFTAQYFARSTELPKPVDTTLENSNCEYWTLEHNNGSSSVIVSLGWDSTTCPLVSHSTAIVLAYNDTTWLSLGQGSIAANSEGGVITAGTLLCASSGYAYRITKGNTVQTNDIGVCFPTITGAFQPDNNNGYASVQGIGGTPQYSFSWSPSGGNTATPSGLSAGIYTVTATDANGYTATASITIGTYIDVSYPLTTSNYYTSPTSPGIDWKRIDYGAVTPDISFGSPSNYTEDRDCGGEDWWYDVKNSIDGSNPDGYIACGYSVFNGYGLTEPGSGCYETGTGVVDCDATIAYDACSYNKQEILHAIEKFDLNGNELWKIYGETFELNHIIQTHDGGYMAIGTTMSTLDHSGNPLPYWSPYSDVSTPLVCSEYPQFLARRIYLIKVDINGWIQWENTYSYLSSTDPNLNVQYAGHEGRDLIEYEDGGVYKYRLVGYYYYPDPTLGYTTSTGLVIDVNNDGSMNWMNAFDYPITNLTKWAQLMAIDKYVNSGTTTFVISGRAFVPGYGPHALVVYLPGTDPLTTTLPTSAVYNYNPSGGNARAWDVAFDNAGNVILPVAEDQVGDDPDNGVSSGMHCEEAVYKISAPSPSNTTTICNYCGTSTRIKLTPYTTHNVSDQLEGYDLRPSVIATKDGGFAFAAERRPVDFNTAYSPLSWTCDGTTYNSGDFKYFEYWNSDAYIAKFDETGIKQWEKTFDVENSPPGSPSYNGKTDWRKKECTFTIAQSNYDGGLLVAGNNSWNEDDAYLVKLYDDCESYSTFSTPDMYDIVDYPQYNQIPISSLPDLTAGGTFYVRGSIHVKNGETLNISGGTQLQFADTKRVEDETDIVVEQGGTLNISGSSTLLTSMQSCTSNMFDGQSHTMWDGIQVLGQGPSVITYQTTGTSGNAGYMTILSGATIANARVGILLDQNIYRRYVDEPIDDQGDLIHDYFQTFDGTAGGGVLISDHANYLNNRRSIIFDLFSTSIPNISGVSYNTFTNNAFMADLEYTDAQGNPEGNNVFLTLWGQYDISVANNTFTGFPTLSQTSRGYGIASFDAIFYPSNNTFTQNTYGINAGASNPMSNFAAYNNTFTKNTDGILVTGIDGAVVKDNNFDVGDGGMFDIGVILANCNGYKVEDNTLFTSDETLTNYPIGILDYYTSPNPATNEIYRNHFGCSTIIPGCSTATPGNFYAAAALLGNLNQTGTGGGNPNMGLVLRCNSFNSNAYDEAVAYPPGIAGRQGGSGITAPANNVFDPDGCSGGYDKAQGELYNSANNFWYYYDDNDGSGFNVTPDQTTPCITTGNVTPKYTFRDFNYTQECPNHTTIPELEARISNDSPIVANLKLLIDGGSTRNLLDTISGGDTTAIINNLTAASPYLSDSVLIAAVNQPTLTTTSLISILQLNLPLSLSVVSAIDNLSSPTSPSPKVDSILIATTTDSTTSAMDTVNTQISYYQSDRELAVNELIELFMADTTGNGIDSIITLLSNESGSHRQSELAGTYLLKKDATRADSVLNVLKNDTAYTNFCRLQTIMRNPFPASDGGIDSLVTQLDSIANDTLHYGSSGARSAISFLTGKIYPPFILLPNVTSGRKAKIDKMQFNSGQKSMLIYPNPATSEATVEVSVPSNSQSQVLTLTDILGQNLKVYSLQPGYNSLTISTDFLKAGMYFVHLISDGKVLSSGRLLKAN